MRALRTLLSAAFILAILPFTTAGTAYVHERRDVGKYQFVVGFINEPAFQDEPNGVDLRIIDKATEQPIEGAEKTLKVQVAFGGGQPREFPLRGRFRMPGNYIADLIPTRSGTYVFTFTGEIDGQQVNERFESGPGRFNDVQPATELHFPVKELSTAELSQQLQAAQQAASEARTFGMLGVGVGVLGLLLGGAALLMGRRREPAGRVSGARQEAHT
jgi:hypothetical protein